MIWFRRLMYLFYVSVRLLKHAPFQVSIPYAPFWVSIPYAPFRVSIPYAPFRVSFPYAPFRVSFTCLCMCSIISHLSVCLEYLTLLAYALKLSYCSFLAWPVILLTDNYNSYPVISHAFGCLIIIIYILSCEFIKVHIFRVTRVLLFIIIFSTSHRIIFISSCASTQWFTDKFIIKWTTSLSHPQPPETMCLKMTSSILPLCLTQIILRFCPASFGVGAWLLYFCLLFCSVVLLTLNYWNM